MVEMWDDNSFVCDFAPCANLEVSEAEQPCQDISLALSQSTKSGHLTFSIGDACIPQIELVISDRVSCESLNEANTALRVAQAQIGNCACYLNKSERHSKEPRLAAVVNGQDDYLLGKTVVEKLDWRDGLEENGRVNSSIKNIMASIIKNEGSTETINWNDNGCGISVGAFQANQKYGQLSLLLSRMQQAKPQLFENLFGPEFANIVRDQPQEICHLSFTNERHTGANQLGTRLQEALKQPAFKQTQLTILREKILQSERIALQYGIHSEKGVGLVADMINQLGVGNDRCGAKHYLKFALGKHSEIAKLEAIVEHDFGGGGRRRRDTRILMNASLSIERPFRA